MLEEVVVPAGAYPGRWCEKESPAESGPDELAAAEHYPTERVGHLWNAFAATALPASGAASYSTGQARYVDGGGTPA
ncbi:hypothetical protein ACFP2T_39060 [Plantactinospora solaniradicis]|uniref:SDR family oxidoreductase n=1 Tax=Plantactinospora solaniradicis TaxID=1723736 RepID=A0ABW1KK27_9ACTN